ncbi:transketolase C-terminal domain-containing protein [Piscinibacter sakaiensis]|uniref:transketolase C-terminal domain-containing protein n=1 Tax=Piscinibacter sakaiensis TaxID=1547922 RepID=UPI00372CBFB4
MRRWAAAHDGPVYLRLRRADAPLPAGALVQPALDAAARLAPLGREVAVVNVHTIKPLDVETVVAMARRCRVVLTAENHSIIGGLGSAVAEALMEAGVAARFDRVGVRDTFAEGGSTPYLFRKYGLDAEAIAARLQALWEAPR